MKGVVLLAAAAITAVDGRCAETDMCASPGDFDGTRIAFSMCSASDGSQYGITIDVRELTGA